MSDDLQVEVQEITGVSIVIDDEPSYEYASDYVLQIDAIKKKIIDYWEPTKKAAHEAHKKILERENEMLNPIKAVREDITGKISVYLTAKRIREQEEQRKAEAERQKAEAEERARIEAERVQAEAEGREEDAKALEAAAEMVHIPVVVTESPKTNKMDAGMVITKEEIKITVTDKKALIEELIKREVLGPIEIKPGELKSYIKVMQLDRFPGLEIQKVVNPTFRGKS
jgi:hypothetical protein